MIISAKRGLQDTNAELKMLRNEEGVMWMRYEQEMGQLEAEFEAERARMQVIDPEQWRLTREAEEIIYQLEENYWCVM